MATQLGAGYVKLTIDYADAMGGMKRQFAGVDREAAAAGHRAGKKFSDAAARETSGIGRKIGDFFDPSIAMGKVGRKAGSVFTTALTGAITLGGTGAAVAAIGATLTKGFERLKSIDEAKAKLKALGNSAGEVQQIMDSALASVKGTAFGLGDAATIAANAVAAGVKPGQELTKYLSMTADAAAVAGTDLGEMGRIINQVQTGQKAYTDDLNQLADRGIPIYQWLGEEAGIAAGDVKKLASEGGISAQMFNAAIQKHIGGAALTMGQSFSGAVQNAEAALGRLGAAVLKPVFGNAAGGLNSLTTGLDSLTNWIDTHQSTIITFWETMGTVAVQGAENFAHGVGGALKALGDMIGGLGNVKGVLDSTMAWFAERRGDHAAAEEFRRSAQEAFGWGESIRAAGDKLANLNLDAAKEKLHGWAGAARTAGGDARNAHGEVAGLGQALGAIPASKNIDVKVNVDEANRIMREFFDRFRDMPVGVNPNIPGNRPARNPLDVIAGPGRAFGGAIRGAGSATSDSIPAWLSNGEHVLTAEDVKRMGGQAGVYAFRSALHRASGGLIDPTRPGQGDPRRGKKRIGGGSWMPPQWWPWAIPGIKPGSDTPIPWWMFPGAKKPWFMAAGGGLGESDRGPYRREYGKSDKKPVFWPWPGWYGGGTGVFDFGPGSNITGMLPPNWTVNPDDILFPEYMPPGQREEWLRRWGDNAKKIKPLGFAGGGAVTGPYDALEFARSVSGSPYGWGGVGPKVWDCSGFMSDIYAILTGKPYQGSERYFTTMGNFPALGFVEGLDPRSVFNIGVNSGHMAGTLLGQNVESGGGHGGPLIGPGAAGASDPQFSKQYHLPIYEDAYQAGTDAGEQITEHYTQGVADGVDQAASTTSTSTTSSTNPYRKIAEGISEILPDFGGLADIGVGGLKETLLPEGFSDPFQWSSVKSLGGLFGFLGGIMPDPGSRAAFGMLSAGLSGSGSGMVNSLKGVIPEPFGTLPSVFPGEQVDPSVAGNIALNPTGPLPGPVNVDNSINIGQNGVVGQDPNAVRDTARREDRTRQRQHMATARIGP